MQTKVSSSDVVKGMYVSSLDRPWIDTPFMFQGFLVQDDEDIQLLQMHCDFVHIDWVRSTVQQPLSKLADRDLTAPDVIVIKRPVSNTNQVSVAQKPTPYLDDKKKTPGIVELSDSRITSSQKSKSRSPLPSESSLESQSRPSDFFKKSDHEGFLSTLTGRMMDLFRSSSSAPHTIEVSSRHPSFNKDQDVHFERPAFIPDHVELSMYVDSKPVEEEIAPAIKAHDRANDVLNKLVQEIQSSKDFTLEETEEVIQNVVDSMVRNPDAMMWITRLRKQDEVAYGHGLQVAVYLVALGRHLGLPRDFLDNLCTIGLLLDIGKIKLPKELLYKKGRLSSEEFDALKSHVQLGLDILKETSGLQSDVLQGIAQHHEREDGSGYPAGLSTGEICLFGRMAAIVDSFSALTHPRPYGETMPAYEALQTLSIFNAELYQTSMVEQFIQAIGVFPVGSMIELSSGEVAVVISHSKVRRLKPRVLIISDSNKQKSSQPTTLDLLYQHQVADKSELYIQRGLPTGAFGLDAREFYLA